jgi:hypothetical protein
MQQYKQLSEKTFYFVESEMVFVEKKTVIHTYTITWRCNKNIEILECTSTRVYTCTKNTRIIIQLVTQNPIFESESPMDPEVKLEDS